METEEETDKLCFFSLREFLHLTLESRLIDACRILLENKIHRLPVVDSNTGTIFSILNQKPILKFIYNILKQKSVKVCSLDISIREAGVGSFKNIAVSPEREIKPLILILRLKVANNETKVIDILNKFLEEGVTALPIVDSEGKLCNIYTKFDVFSLESFFDLEIPVSEASKHKIYFEGVYNCKGWSQVSIIRGRVRIVPRHGLRLLSPGGAGSQRCQPAGDRGRGVKGGGRGDGLRPDRLRGAEARGQHRGRETRQDPSLPDTPGILGRLSRLKISIVFRQ